MPLGGNLGYSNHLFKNSVAVFCSQWFRFIAVPVRSGAGQCGSWNMAGSSGSVQYRFLFASSGSIRKLHGFCTEIAHNLSDSLIWR